MFWNMTYGLAERVVPTNFRHQLCIVMHCRAKLQRTPSFRLYKSIAYTSFHGFEPGGREFESLRVHHSRKFHADLIVGPVKKGRSIR